MPDLFHYSRMLIFFVNSNHGKREDSDRGLKKHLSMQIMVKHISES
jgi:hypothetical protein